MMTSSFGNVLKMTTWGESYSPAIGVVIDGCPSNILIDEEEIQQALDRRRPGKNPLTSMRREKDKVKILSGVFEGKTTGAPISLLIENFENPSEKDASFRTILRPGHAQFTYREKYGHFDPRGGGRASARETACRVAAGVLAKKILKFYEIKIVAFVQSIGEIEMPELEEMDLKFLEKKILKSSVFCPDATTSLKMEKKIEELRKEGDTIGGRIEVTSSEIPSGLGDPIYEKLSANLAKALFSIPAVKAVEIGDGFASSLQKGSFQNDPFFVTKDGKIRPKTNHAGGILGGISTGLPLRINIGFKPPSRIAKEQKGMTFEGEEKNCSFGDFERQDLCVVIRAVPVVEAMVSFVLADAILLNSAMRFLCDKPKKERY